MRALDYTLTIQINIVGAIGYAVVLGGVLVLAVIGVACLV